VPGQTKRALAVLTVRPGGKNSSIIVAEGESEELNMTKVIHGKVRGKTIELAEDLGLPEGQEVAVSVQTVPATPPRMPGEGLLRTEGALADDAHWDATMDEVYRERKNDTRREIQTAASSLLDD
jgi:hypothetical protein